MYNEMGPLQSLHGLRPAWTGVVEASNGPAGSLSPCGLSLKYAAPRRSG